MSATTSAELAGVISDETGTGAVVLAVSPSFTGDAKAVTATAGDSDTSIATTAFVTTAVNLPSIIAKTTNYTALTTDSSILFNVSGTAAGLTLTIPAAAAGNVGKIYTIRKVDTTNYKLNFSPVLQLTPAVTATSTAAVTVSSVNYAKTFRIQSDGSNWNIID
jgi:hypothetical protein